MQHEVLAILASHPSPLISQPSPLLHPGELSSLSHLNHIASLHSRISTFCSPSSSSSSALSPTPSLAALKSVLSTRLVRPYLSTLINLESAVLRGQVGGNGGLPLSAITAEVAGWEGLLLGVGRVLDALERGFQVESSGMGGETVDEEDEEESNRSRKWTAAPLLTLLYQHANTGLSTLGSLIQHSIKAIETIWLSNLSQFLIWGRISTEPLILVSPTTSSTTTSQRYTFPSTSLPHLPSLTNSTTRQSLLSDLNTISLALSVLHSLPPPSSPFAPSRASHALASSSSSSHPPITLPKQLQQTLINLLTPCTGPNDPNFPRQINTISTHLSTHLLTLHLPSSLLLSSLTSLSNHYLHRSGSLSTNLLLELETLGAKHRRTAAGGTGRGLSEVALSGALGRARGLAEVGEGEEEGDWELRAVVVREEEENENDGEGKRWRDGSEKVLGVGLKLDFVPSREALGLLITEGKKKEYQLVWSMLIGLKEVKRRVVGIWATLSHTSRSLSSRSTLPSSLTSSTNLTKLSWSLTRSHLWFLTTLDEHFSAGVIASAWEILLRSIAPPPSSDDDEEEEEEDVNSEEEETLAPTTMRGGGGGTATSRRWASSSYGGASSSRGERRNKPKVPPMDFTALTTLHEVYLKTVLSGLFLDDGDDGGREVREVVEELLEGVWEWCALVRDRWNGEVGSGNVEEDRERERVVLELSESFHTHLNTLFSLLSSAPPPLPPTSTPTSSTTSIHPTVQTAKKEAEALLRDCAPRLLLRLDGGRWFSRVERERDGWEE